MKNCLYNQPKNKTENLFRFIKKVCTTRSGSTKLPMPHPLIIAIEWKQLTIPNYFHASLFESEQFEDYTQRHHFGHKCTVFGL